MSLSETRRLVALTEEQREAIREAARRSRFVEDVVPTMIADLQRRTSSLAAQGALPVAQQQLIEQQISTAGDVDALRAVAVQLIHATPSAIAGTAPHQGGQQPVGDAMRLHPSQTVVAPQAPAPVPGSRTSAQVPAAQVSLPATVEIGELVVDHLQLTAELDALTRAAAELAVPVPSTATRQLDAAERALSAADPAVAAANMRTARTAIDALAATVDDALADAEQQAQTLTAVTAALQHMGFTVTGVASAEVLTGAGKGADTRVEAETADGRTAEVALIGDGEQTMIDAAFTDANDAVPAGRPGAEEICTAVHDAEGFQRRLGSTPGLALGPVVALSRPTRSNGGIASGGTASSATRRARRTSATNISKRSTR